MPSSSTVPLGRTLVVGATGLVGRALVDRLRGRAGVATLTLLLRRTVPLFASWPDVQLIETPQMPGDAPLPPHDSLFLALGTTMRDAGSRAAFEAIDRDLVVSIAQASRAAGARRVAVVSSKAANPRSPVFYLRCKGEMEAAIAGLGFETVVVARPSLLIGDRDALGQALRPGERISTVLSRPFIPWLPGSLRPVEAGQVADRLIEQLALERTGVRVLENADLLDR